MIFFDTETTGLINPKASELDVQPEIIEFAAIKTDDNLKEVSRLEFLCRPELCGTEIPIGASKTNGIYWNHVEGKKPFSHHFRELSDFFRGEEKLIAHNASYDVGMLTLEIRRLGMEARFPWPTIHHCTFQMAEEIGGLGSKSLSNLYEHFFQEKLPNAHRAIGDVLGMMKVYKKMMSLQK